MGAIMMRGRDADYSARSIVRTGICPVGIGPGSGTVAICFERHDLPSLTQYHYESFLALVQLPFISPRDDEGIHPELHNC